MPQDPTRFFTGREDVLRRLHTALRQGSVALTQALSGLGGIGKTQTALEYARRYRGAYTAVLWTRADDAATLTQGLARLATELGIAGADVERDAQVAAMQGWLASEAHRGWLLIADNADFDGESWTPEHFGELLPARLTGCLLLTSRFHYFGALEVGAPLELNTLWPEEAMLLLKRRVGRDAQALGEEEQDALAAIADELGYLPLALEQAGAYIGAKQKSYAGYLGQYRRETEKLLREARPQAGRYNRDKETKEYHTVWTTWTLNFRAVRGKSRAAADLLTASAFLAPAAIPGELIVKGASKLSKVLGKVFANAEGDAIKDRYDDLLLPLTRYSLAKKDVDQYSYTVHRLVQQVVRDGLSEAEQQAWRKRIVLALCAAYPGSEFADWPQCERLLAHWRLAAEYISEDSVVREGMAFAEAGTLLNQIGYYLRERGLYAEAEPLYQQALGIRQQVLPTTHPDVAASLNNLAELYRAQGRYEEAEPLYQQALLIMEAALGQTHPSVASSLNNLAELYRAQGRYEEAEPLYQQALLIMEAALGQAHPDVAMVRENYALCLARLGKGAEASAMWERAQASRAAHAGKGANG